MQAWWQPRGRLDPRIYWFRRGLLLAVVLLLTIGLVAALRACSRPGVAGVPTPTPSVAEALVSPSLTPTPSGPVSEATVSASAQPEESPIPGLSASAAFTPITSPTFPVCQVTSLSIQVSGENPLHAGRETHFDIAVTNSGAPCLFNPVGQLHLSVTSGSDPIWSTRDCDSWQILTDEETLIEPGTPVSYSVPWPVKRSNGCEIVETTLGNGTYVATAELGRRSSRFVTVIE